MCQPQAPSVEKQHIVLHHELGDSFVVFWRQPSCSCLSRWNVIFFFGNQQSLREDLFGGVLSLLGYIRKAHQR